MSKRFILPPGYTQIPNELLEEVLRDAGLAELRVTMVIARRTFGFGLGDRLLTNAELCNLCNLSRQSVTDGLKAGENRGFIGKRNLGGNRWAYGIIVKNPDSQAPSQLPSNQDVDFPAARKSSSQGKQSPPGGNKQPGAAPPAAAKKGTKRKAADLYKPDPDDPVDAVIVELFQSWHSGTGRNGATQLTVARAGKIRARLKEAAAGADDPSDLEIALAHAAGELREAVAGMVESAWHRDNAQQEFDQLFRKRDRIEAFFKRYRAEKHSADGRNAAYDTTRANPELEGAQA